MKRMITLILCVVLVIGLFCGCGKDDTAYVPTGDGLTWDEDYTGPTNTAGQDTSEQALKLTYYPDRSMNPFVCTDFTNRALFSLLYQSLFTVDRSYNIEPQLCKSYRVSQDMKTYTFYLESATFTDGSALNVQDVVASLLAAKDSALYSGRFLHISQIALSDDGGVTVSLSTPMENLPLLLDIPIIKKDQLQQDQPLGTGPYYLDTVTQTPLLRRNTNWWCKADMVITAPAITLTQAQSIAGIRDEFEFEGLSLVCADPGSDRYADYRCDYELWDCENNIFLFLSCNMDSEVFSDAQVRAALTKAIDRDMLAESYYRGFARSACLPASPLSPNYSQTLADKYTYDGGEALTKAVTDASLTASPVILLVNSEDSLRVRVARYVAEVLTASGLTVDLQALNTGKYQQALKLRNYDLYLGQTKLSANMDLSAFFSSKGSLSYGNISDVSFYTLCAEALANHGNYYTLHKAVMDDGRLCPILFRSYAIYAERGLLTGLTPARDNVFYYSLEKTMEKALITE